MGDHKIEGQITDATETLRPDLELDEADADDASGSADAAADLQEKIASIRKRNDVALRVAFSRNIDQVDDCGK